MKIRILFGKFHALAVHDHEIVAMPFRCPRCGAEVIAQSVMEITLSLRSRGKQISFHVVRESRMTRLAQLPLSYFEKMPETYIPTEEDRARGNWACVFEGFDEIENEPDTNSNCHVIPLKGVYHQLCSDCWCAPKSEPMNNGHTMYKHNVSQ